MDADYLNCKRYIKYKNHFRMLLVQIDSFQNSKYIELKESYKNKMYNFHKFNIKLLAYKNKNYTFKIGLVGYDGQLKKVYKRFNKDKIINNVIKMPIGEKEHKIDKKALSLYEDYNPKTTVHGLGFKDEEMAKKTINKIKNKSIAYQKSVINTMYYRAKYHPHQTKDMKKAMKIFDEYKKKLL